MKPTIVIFGTGAIGASVGGWVAPHHQSLYLLSRGQTAEVLKSKGVTLYQTGDEAHKKTIPVQVIEDLAEVPQIDVLVVTVKNYSLAQVAQGIKDKVGDGPIIVAMQNGVENQQILPAYFSKVVYCVVCYNAWADEPGTVGYQKKGPLVLGTIKNELQTEMNDIATIFNGGVETVITSRLQDAAHSKMIINLANSLTTLVGYPQKDLSSMGLFQKLLSNLTYEGVQIARAAGYKESKLGGMPPWMLIAASAKLPQFLTRTAFKKNVSKMVMSSMAQDVVQRGGTDSELESLNGYFLKLAAAHNLHVPYSEAIYDLCQRAFAKPDFHPLDVGVVWEMVKGQF